MNAVNGAALLASVRAGDLVTARDHDGSVRCGRAELRPTGRWYARTGPLFSVWVTESTIIKVERRGEV